MGNALQSVVVLVLCFVPTVVAALLMYRKRRAWEARSKVPFEELRRRPAGESLRIKLQALDEKIDERINLLAVAPFAVVLAGYFSRSSGMVFGVGAFVFCTVWAAGFGWWIYRMSRERANYQLGFDGERFVGEELNRLAALGFEVFHDLPFDGFNMDHVLVGRSGVFLVETKTRRKPVKGSGG